MARNAGFCSKICILQFSVCPPCDAACEQRVTARKSWRNAKWKQYSTTGSNHFWRTTINRNFNFNFWLLDHQCIILIDSLMETQLFENKNASTEIIGPVVLNLGTGIPYFFSDPSTERHLATVTSATKGVIANCWEPTLPTAESLLCL